MGALVGAVVTPLLLGKSPLWCFGTGGLVLFVSGAILAGAVAIERSKMRLAPNSP
ncbi:hypothetical protein D3C86_1004000 [compost metagenome]